MSNSCDTFSLFQTNRINWNSIRITSNETWGTYGRIFSQSKSLLLQLWDLYRLQTTSWNVSNNVAVLHVRFEGSQLGSHLPWENIWDINDKWTFNYETWDRTKENWIKPDWFQIIIAYFTNFRTHERKSFTLTKITFPGLEDLYT